MFDKEDATEFLRKWYPIVIAGVSSFLDFFALLIGMQWSVGKTIEVTLISFGSTLIISIFMILIINKQGVSRYSYDYKCLESKDIYDFTDCEKTIYKRILTIKFNRPSLTCVMFQNEVDGEITDIKAYQRGQTSKPYNVNIYRINGRKAISINLGTGYKKGQILSNLCIETTLVNSFPSENEGVNVDTFPDQRKCSVVLQFSNDKPPKGQQIDWAIFYENNISPIENGLGNVITKEDGAHEINQDFSDYIGKGLGLKCSISWRW